jgi:hypothetical protein
LRWATAALVAALASGCVSRSVPFGKHPSVGLPASARLEEVPVHGHRITLETLAGTLDGELLAVANPRVWVQPSVGPPRVVEFSAILEASLWVKPQWPGDSVVAFVATSSALLPLQGRYVFATGSVHDAVARDAAMLERGYARSSATYHTLAIFAEYARFPRGPPPRLVETALPFGDERATVARAGDTAGGRGP